METKEKLTTAENTLSVMAKVVLVLGIIGSIFIFVFSCLSWNLTYGGELDEVDGINWLGFPTLIYCIMATLIAWSLLSVIVEISVNARSKGNNNVSVNWQKEFAVAKTLDLNDKAKEILYRVILESDEFKKVLAGGNEIFHQSNIDALNEKFAPYLKEIGEDKFKYTKAIDILNVFR